MIHITHVSTVHTRTDARIRAKEAQSLAAALDARVSLVVQDGLGDERDGLVFITSAGPRLPRMRNRLMTGIWRMWHKIRAMKPDIVHFHDPELIPIGLLLKLQGIKVIYDVHEDYPRNYHDDHPQAGFIFRRVVPIIHEIVEWVATQIFDGTVTASEKLATRFPRRKTIAIMNFPVLEEFDRLSSQLEKRDADQICYIGGIGEVRGAVEMITAMDLTAMPKARLALAGPFSSELFEKQIKEVSGWSRVDYYGVLGRTEVVDLLKRSRAGLVTLHDLPVYQVSLPIKMFEYMAAGLPIIASDFPFWRELLNDYDCAIFVNPHVPQEIAGAIDWILSNPDQAYAMGARGRYGVLSRYNWAPEAEKLVAFYTDRFAIPRKGPLQ